MVKSNVESGQQRVDVVELQRFAKLLRETVMKKYFVIGLLVMSFILSPVFVSAQTNQSKNSCIQDCFKTYEKTCVGTGRLGVTPFCLTENEVSTKCQLICGESASAVLNSNYPMKIGQRVIIEDYDKMEMTLLQIKAKCIGEKEITIKDKNSSKTSKACTKLEDITAVLRIKKNNEETFLEIKNEKGKEAFGVRVDFDSYLASAFPVDQETGEFTVTGAGTGGGVSEPEGGVFGVYEKGVGDFWSRILSWFKRFF